MPKTFHFRIFSLKIYRIFEFFRRHENPEFNDEKTIHSKVQKWF